MANANKIRTIIELSDELGGALDDYCKSQGISRVAGIRQSIETHLAAQQDRRLPLSDYWGCWNRPGDSLAIELAYREAW